MYGMQPAYLCTSIFFILVAKAIPTSRLSEHVSLFIIIIVNDIKPKTSNIIHSCPNEERGNIMPLSPKRQGGRKRVAAKRKVSEIEGGDRSHTAAKKKRVRPYWSLTLNDSIC